MFHMHQLDRSLLSHKYIQIFNLNIKKSDATLFGIFELVGLRGSIDEDILETLNIYGVTHVKINVEEMLKEYTLKLESERIRDFDFEVIF